MTSPYLRGGRAEAECKIMLVEPCGVVNTETLRALTLRRIIRSVTHVTFLGLMTL